MSDAINNGGPAAKLITTIGLLSTFDDSDGVVAKQEIQSVCAELTALRQRVLELEKDKARMFKLVVACSPFVRIAQKSTVYFSVLEKNIAVDLCDQLDAIRDAE